MKRVNNEKTGPVSLWLRIACKTALTLAAMLMTVGRTSAQDTMVAADSPHRALYAQDSSVPEFVRMVGEDFSRVDLELPDSVFFANSELAIFTVNKWELDMASPLVRRIENSVLPIARREGWRLVGVTVRGAASPEGPLHWNTTLAQRRAQALTDYLRRYFDIGSANPSDSTSRLALSTTPEDYALLHHMMRTDADPDADRVGVAILMGDGNLARIKINLQRIDGGRLWRRLLKQYYPRLRAARVMLFFQRETPVALEPVATHLSTAMQPIPVQPLAVQAPKPLRQHKLSVRTNLLYDFFYWPDYGFAPSPNVELEFYPRRGHFTYNIGLTTPYWHRWNRYQFWQIRHYTLGARYYFHPEDKELDILTHTRWFVGANVFTNIYGIGLSKQRGWKGEGLGAEVTGGYVVPLGSHKRWRLEFVVGLGLMYTRYDPYVYGNPITGVEDGLYYYKYTGKKSDFRRRNHQLWWFGPTTVGINLSADLMFWKNK